LVQRSDVAFDEHIERQTPPLFVRLVGVRGVLHNGWEQTDVVGFRFIAPALTVVDIESIDIEIECRGKWDEAQLIPM
jgi:hypothetical protein